MKRKPTQNTSSNFWRRISNQLFKSKSTQPKHSKRAWSEWNEKKEVADARFEMAKKKLKRVTLSTDRLDPSHYAVAYHELIDTLVEKEQFVGEPPTYQPRSHLNQKTTPTNCWIGPRVTHDENPFTHGIPLLQEMIRVGRNTLQKVTQKNKSEPDDWLEREVLSTIRYIKELSRKIWLVGTYEYDYDTSPIAPYARVIGLPLYWYREELEVDCGVSSAVIDWKYIMRSTQPLHTRINYVGPYVVIPRDQVTGKQTPISFYRSLDEIKEHDAFVLRLPQTPHENRTRCNLVEEDPLILLTFIVYRLETVYNQWFQSWTDIGLYSLSSFPPYHFTESGAKKEAFIMNQWLETMRKIHEVRNPQDNNQNGDLLRYAVSQSVDNALSQHETLTQVSRSPHGNQPLFHAFSLNEWLDVTELRPLSHTLSKKPSSSKPRFTVRQIK